MSINRHVLLWGRLLMPVVVMVVIFLFSMENSGESSGRSTVIAEFLGTPEWTVRKGAHVLMFGLLGVAWFYALWGRKKMSLATRVWVSILLVAVYAVFDEMHQSFVSGRAGLLTDVLIDTAGGAVFVLVFAVGGGWLAKRRVGRKK